MGKLPAYLFYTKDWRTDPALCRVSKTARDTWMDMNCLMFDSEERGVLVSGGTPWTDEQIARATRGEYLTNLRDIAELLDMGVAFRDNRGAIFCKRMVRDEQERIAAKKRKRQSRLSHTLVTSKSPIETASETEVDFDVGSKPKAKSSFNEQEVSLMVMNECHLSGKHIQQTIETQLLSCNGEDLKSTAERMIQAISRYKSSGGSKIYLWLSEGEWLRTEEPHGSKRQQEFEDAIRRAEENAESDAGFPKFQT